MARISKKEARRLHALRIRLSRARRRQRDDIEGLSNKDLAARASDALASAVKGLPKTRFMVEEAVIELTAPTMTTRPEGWGEG